MFFFTTTGWMMWNFLVSSLLLGVCPVLFDGSPAHPAPDVLWQVAHDAGVRLFGASPAYVELMSGPASCPGTGSSCPGCTRSCWPARRCPRLRGLVLR